MTKLEQVARAIADYWREHGFDPSEPSEGAARAAVEAMRYPGEAAVQFGDAVRGNHDRRDPEREARCLSC